MASSKLALKAELKAADSLAQEAYDWLVTAITTFKIPTNSQISENKLATELGFSRTPVREALMKLETEGLVTRGESGRFTVAMLTKKDVDEAMDLLLMLDTYMYKKAAENITKEIATELRNAAKAMFDSAKNKDRESWSLHDLKYHELIMSIAKNEMVSEVSRVTRRRIQRFWARSASGAKDLATCSQEHVDIAKAIIEKDLKAIEKAVAEHINHLRANMHEIVSSMEALFGRPA